MDNSKAKRHQYSDEDGDGNTIWIDYDPKRYTPESDTRVIGYNSKEQPMEWISVKERLPVNDLVVEVRTDQDKTGTMLYSLKYGWHILKDNAKVDAWREIKP